MTEKDEQIQVPFDLTDELGTLMPAKSWMKETSEMARQLGVGQSLFLLSTKAFAWLFVFLTILNFPLFAYYYYGKDIDHSGHSTVSIFTDFSLGNVGSSHVTCGTSRYAGVIYGFS